VAGPKFLVIGCLLPIVVFARLDASLKKSLLRRAACQSKRCTEVLARARADREISSACTSRDKVSSSCCLGILATALISSFENCRPRAAPICATSRVGAMRSRRARSEACKVDGIASGTTGPIAS